VGGRTEEEMEHSGIEARCVILVGLGVDERWRCWWSGFGERWLLSWLRIRLVGRLVMDVVDED
jgi:hypothetical protein